MDRILCLIFCALVIVVSIYALSCCGGGDEPDDMVTEPSTPSTVATEVTKPTEPQTTAPPDLTLYDVPLSDDLQLYIQELCRPVGIDPAIVMAVIQHESGFKASAVGDSGNSLGLMQIQPRWHYERMETLDCPDLFDPYQNVTVGIDYLAELYDRYDGDIGMALTAYNAGPTGANRLYFSKGVYASKYALEVMAYADEIR